MILNQIFEDWTVFLATISIFFIAFLSLAYLAVQIRYLRSPLYRLPGPPRSSIFLGVLGEVFKLPPGDGHLKWANTYGPVVQYPGLLGSARLFVIDPKALNHMLMNKSYDFPRPSQLKGEIASIFGKGILFAEGDDHKRQRRLMVPAFSPSHLKELIPTFFEKAFKLKDRWVEVIDSGQHDFGRTLVEDQQSDEVFIEKLLDPKEDGGVVIEVIKWLSKTTLDIIGESGFGHDFRALDGAADELGEAISGLFQSGEDYNGGPLVLALQLLYFYFPAVFKLFPTTEAKKTKKMFQTVSSEGMKIVQTRKKEVEDSLVVEAHTQGGRDLLSLCIKANIAAQSSGGGKNSMSDEEMIGQIVTFILAGHETTATSLTWCLYLISLNPEIQSKLRNEALASTEDEFASLPYLDAVVRETMRRAPAVQGTSRSSIDVDNIPLEEPVKLKPRAGFPWSLVGLGGPVEGSYKNEMGDEMIDSIAINKGQQVWFSIEAFNRSKKIWGEDAEEFKPERWLGRKDGENAKHFGGGWSDLLTFLAGPRSCIGYRFAILEMKAILWVLIRNFEFELPSENMKVDRKSVIVTRPRIVGDKKGNRMPLRIKKYIG